MPKYSFGTEYNIYYQGTNIPKNKFNIRDIPRLNEFEKALLLKSYSDFHRDLNNNPVFNETYFKTLHKATLQTLYDFAGEYRDQDVSKGDTLFCKAKYIHSQIKLLFEKLETENHLNNFQYQPKESFAERIAYYMGELIAIHPFWEFNGRIIRMFFDMIAVYNGYEYINYSLPISKEITNPFIQASIECVQAGDSSRLNEIIFIGLKKT